MNDDDRPEHAMSTLSPTLPLAPPAPAELEERHAFVVELAQALHMSGAPAHRLEATVSRLSAALQLDTDVLATPTALFVAGSHSSVLRASPGAVNLSLRASLDSLAGSVVEGHLSPAEARAALAALLQAPARHGPWRTLLASTLTSGCAAVFMGGGPREIGVATLLGGLATAMSRWLGSQPSTERLSQTVAGVLVAGGTVLAAHQLRLSTPLVLVAGLIGFMPGLSMTLGLTELATGHLSSGSARLAGVTSTLLMLGLGSALGWEAAEALAGPARAMRAAGTPAWAPVVALLVDAACFSALFQARWRDLPWILVACALAFYGSSYGEQMAGPQLGAGLGALAVGLLGNALSRWRSIPAAVPTMPGLLVLVPGSMGFRSLRALMDQQTLAGVDTAVSALLVAASLAAGLMLAHAMLPSSPGSRETGMA